MKKQDKLNLIQSAIENPQLCRCYFTYDENYYYYYPNAVNEKFLLGQEVNDFLLDGYCIRKISQLKKVEIKDDMCPKIIKAEGILDGLTPPEIDITDWHSAFVSLKGLGEIIIIERESIDPDESLFAIGRIQKVNKTNLVFSHFDADGVWQDEVYVIPFTQITSVTIGSRYSRFFAKYV